jgi:hypothetical protein
MVGTVRRAVRVMYSVIRRAQRSRPLFNKKVISDWERYRYCSCRVEHGES